MDLELGTPNSEVTHWGLSRRTAGKWEPLDFPNAQGVREKVWPIEECSIALIQKRHGPGEYRCYWLTIDPEATQPEQRRVSQGNGNIFRLDAPLQAEPEEHAAGDGLYLADRFGPLAIGYGLELVNPGDAPLARYRRSQLALALSDGRSASLGFGWTWIYSSDGALTRAGSWEIGLTARPLRAHGGERGEKEEQRSDDSFALG